MRELLARTAVDGVRVSFPTELPCFKSPAAPPAGWETTVVSFASDLPFYETWGQRYQLGPGSIRVAHTTEERIAKADLTRGVALYVRLATELLASRD
jgi:acetylornithine deacetylase